MRTLPVTLHAVVAPLELTASAFEVSTGVGTVTIRGHMTVGTRGWALRAGAACHRSRITIHVTAVEVDTTRAPDLEHHRYEATIHVRRPGRYALRVAHSYLLRDRAGAAFPNPVFERVLVVP